jgi:hypothetical protein
MRATAPCSGYEHGPLALPLIMLSAESSINRFYRRDP